MAFVGSAFSLSVDCVEVCVDGSPTGFGGEDDGGCAGGGGCLGITKSSCTILCLLAVLRMVG